MSKAPQQRNILIMTATITPPFGVSGLQRTDPLLRLEDYCAALRYYCRFLGGCIDAIVFAENSSSDMTSLERVAAETVDGTVEFLAIDSKSNDPAGGRCSGESRILDAVMAGSRIVAAAGRTDIFWKVTGRYRVLNMQALIRTRPTDFDFYCDLRSSPSPWADMRFMAWTKQGFIRCLEGVGELIREDENRSRPGEETLYFVLRKRTRGGRAVTCLKREPLIDGVRAFDSKNWSEGRQKVVYYVRQVQRLLFRRVWI